MFSGLLVDTVSSEASVLDTVLATGVSSAELSLLQPANQAVIKANASIVENNLFIENPPLDCVKIKNQYSFTSFIVPSAS